ncbi:MAG: hypothetical protein KF752_18855 [Pirellulaceae bacterium]|nr:hypothetical protein [Pirellulaceae bacterium]
MAEQYSPDHPRVIQMVEKAVDFLSQQSMPSHYDGSDVLVGYCIFLVRGDANHPKVVVGIDTAKRIIASTQRTSANDQSGPKESVVYDLAVACILLATVDSRKYSAELEASREFLIRVQKPHGGFGYLNEHRGDTSQVQYAVLAMWMLEKVGLKVSELVVERTIEYLMGTQDPTGSWGYQATPTRGALVPQQNPTRSLGTAGICALLMAGDLLKLYGVRGELEDGLPSVFERIDLNAKKEKSSANEKAKLGYKDVEPTIQRAFNYQDNSPPYDGDWYYYWRYSQERYESFREVVVRKQNRSPDWYNEGVEALAKVQSENGSWSNKTSLAGYVVDTSFAVLFLLRSTQRAIGKLSEGVTFGGYELPTDIANVRMRGERLVSDEEASVENLLSMMEDASQRVREGMLPNDMQLSPDAQVRAAQVARLTRLLGSSSFSARRIAAKLLGRCEDIRVVPELIYALQDPDPLVPQIAEEGLRLLSRKLSTRLLQQDPSPEQRARAVQYWKEWYRGVQPSHVFVDP